MRAYSTYTHLLLTWSNIYSTQRGDQTLTNDYMNFRNNEGNKTFHTIWCPSGKDMILNYSAVCGYWLQLKHWSEKGTFRHQYWNETEQRNKWRSFLVNHTKKSSQNQFSSRYKHFVKLQGKNKVFINRRNKPEKMFYSRINSSSHYLIFQNVKRWATQISKCHRCKTSGPISTIIKEMLLSL